MDIKSILKYREILDQFAERHPKVPAFVNAVKSRSLPVGTVAEVTLTFPDGSSMKTNVRLQQEDIDILKIFEK